MKARTNIEVDERLISSASNLFSKRGFSAVSIREIAKKAKVNSACIAYHFGDKHGLYQAILNKHLNKARTNISSIKSQPGSPAEQLILFQEVIINHFRSEPEFTRLFHRVLLSEEVKLKKLLTDFYITPLFHTLLDAAREAEIEIKFLTPEKLVWFMIALPGYWTLFQKSYKSAINSEAKEINILEDAYEMTKDCLMLFLGVENE